MRHSWVNLWWAWERLPDLWDSPSIRVFMFISQQSSWHGWRLMSCSSPLSPWALVSILSDTPLTLSLSRRARNWTSTATAPLPTSGACGHITGLSSDLNSCFTWSNILFRSDQFLTVGNLQTADTVMEEVSPETGFSWIKSSTKCGLRTGNVDTRVAGNWKCHLGKIALLICNLILIFSTNFLY